MAEMPSESFCRTSSGDLQPWTSCDGDFLFSLVGLQYRKEIKKAILVQFLAVTITSPIAFAEATKIVGSKNKDEKDTGEAIGQPKREIFWESDQPAEATNMKYITRIAIHGNLLLET